MEVRDAAYGLLRATIPPPRSGVGWCEALAGRDEAERGSERAARTGSGRCPAEGDMRTTAARFGSCCRVGPAAHEGDMRANSRLTPLDFSIGVICPLLAAGGGTAGGGVLNTSKCHTINASAGSLASSASN